MGLFGDIFRGITAPARFVARSPIGQMAKTAAPFITGVGPIAGVGISAGIGALEQSDEDVGEMLKGAAVGGGQGAVNYGIGKGVGSIISGFGSDAAAGAATDVAGGAGRVDPATGVTIDRAIGSGAPAPVSSAGASVDPGGVHLDEAIYGEPAAAGGASGGDGGFMGLGDMPDWLKWSMLLKGGTDLAGSIYDVYDNERARNRGKRFASALVGDQTSRRPTPSSYGGSYDPAGDVIRRRVRALEREF